MTEKHNFWWANRIRTKEETLSSLSRTPSVPLPNAEMWIPPDLRGKPLEAGGDVVDVPLGSEHRLFMETPHRLRRDRSCGGRGTLRHSDQRPASALGGSLDER